MKYKSELTGIEYNTEKECLDADARYISYCNAEKKKRIGTRNEKLDDDTFAVINENGENVAKNEDEERLRKEIEEQDKVVRDCFEVYKETINKANYDLNLAYKNAKQKKEDAYDLVMKQTNALQDKLVEYNNKYGAFKWADGTVEKIGVFPIFEGNNLLNKFLKGILGI